MTTSKTKKPTQISIRAHRKEIKKVETEKANLLEQIEELQKESVSKEVLRNEPIFDRLNWWFKDLTNIQKNLAHFGGIVTVVILVAGLYFLSAKAGDGSDKSEYTSLIIMIISAVLGLDTQLKAFKVPVKYNEQ